MVVGGSASVGDGGGCGDASHVRRQLAVVQLDEAARVVEDAADVGPVPDLWPRRARWVAARLQALLVRARCDRLLSVDGLVPAPDRISNLNCRILLPRMRFCSVYKRKPLAVQEQVQQSHHSPRSNRRPSAGGVSGSYSALTFLSDPKELFTS